MNENNQERQPVETQTCPRRMTEMGPWKYEENLDAWEQRGPDRVCSFCGSMHPDDFEQFLDRCLSDEGARVELTDKSYKVYVIRPEIHNAMDGAIKFYMHHASTDPVVVLRVQPKFAQAVRLSNTRSFRDTNAPKEDA